MPVSKFTVGGVLQLLFLYINESPATLAEFYIDRDRTLVYKWLRDAAILPKKHVPDIIRFVRENSTQTVRLRIRNETDQFISESGLNATTKKTLLSNNDFDKYLEEVLYIAILEMKTKRLPQSASSQEGQEIAGASSSQAEGWSPEILPEATKPGQPETDCTSDISGYPETDCTPVISRNPYLLSPCFMRLLQEAAC